MTKLELANAIAEYREKVFGCDRYRMKKALGRMTTRELEMIYRKEIAR